MTVQHESDLYKPVKSYLEDRGYTVKGEVNGVDLVACHPDQDPVLVELKKSFNLKLIFQGIDRLSLADRVYLAVPASSVSGNVLNQYAKPVKKLCRRLGLGLIQVYFGPRRVRVEVLVEPGLYRPKKRSGRLKALREEFSNRSGDPNIGGVTGKLVMTAYRQQVIQVAAFIAGNGASKVSRIREATGIKKTASILQKNYYGWFERVVRGEYGLTERGRIDFESYFGAG